MGRLWAGSPGSSMKHFQEMLLLPHPTLTHLFFGGAAVLEVTSFSELHLRNLCFKRAASSCPLAPKPAAAVDNWIPQGCPVNPRTSTLLCWIPATQAAARTPDNAGMSAHLWPQLPTHAAIRDVFFQDKGDTTAPPQENCFARNFKECRVTHAPSFEFSL